MQAVRYHVPVSHSYLKDEVVTVFKKHQCEMVFGITNSLYPRLCHVLTELGIDKTMILRDSIIIY